MVETTDRAENVDDKTRFTGLIEGLQKVKAKFDLPLIYPVHPRARKQLSAFGIDTSGPLVTFIFPTVGLSLVGKNVR
jgi:UDP-N-acetylglucosamine 2-epimerase (non-hydrolysing)